MAQDDRPSTTRRGVEEAGPESLSLAGWIHAAGGACLIVIAWAAAEALVSATGLPLPPAIVGMGLLFMMIVLRPALVLAIRPAGQGLLKRLPLFLYPVTAGFLTLPPIGFADLLKLLLVLCASLIVSMLVCVRIFHMMSRDDR
ncbi:CidA/LrgA family protein [Xinfangfangia sp. D13-10-4-6]|uniref:CidA/LrgA family protein n=1 Tax=Pseudogemmobacter hezensis TaxID=2737662 RepID=UPI0015533F92|nr:CidA/LrgA family protein [Pseudogemmobacter hezensis]NPD16832.1 CidA/LrgA family protein [Pseudogemmobacter hezensis]